MYLFVYCSGTPRDLHVLTHAFPTRRSSDLTQAIEAFKPNSACWTMLDEFQSSKIVGWKELEPLLRATLETSKTGNAQRLAAIMFDGADMVQYAALMKNPKKWLTGDRKSTRLNSSH